DRHPDLAERPGDRGIERHAELVDAPVVLVVHLAPHAEVVAVFGWYHLELRRRIAERDVARLVTVEPRVQEVKVDAIDVALQRLGPVALPYVLERYAGPLERAAF